VVRNRYAAYNGIGAQFQAIITAAKEIDGKGTKLLPVEYLEVDDPYGSTPEDYKTAARKIEQYVRRVYVP